MESLRIGMIAPPWFTVPPTGYRGTEWVVNMLADGLARQGHHVTLFASGGSRCLGQLQPLYSSPPSAMLGHYPLEATHAAAAYDRWEEFHLIHDHTELGILMGSRLPIPAVHTVHSEIRPALGAYYHVFPAHCTRLH